YEHEEKEQSEFAEWKKSRLEAMGPDEKAALVKDEEAFEDFQEEPDSAEDLSKIPSLSIDDIPRTVETIGTFSGDINGVPFYSLDVFTNGIVYVDLAFDIQDLAGDYLPLFPFFCRAAAAAGLPGMPYDKVAQQLAIKTGGFSSFLEVNSVDGYDELVAGERRRRSRAFVVFRLKTLETGFGEAMDLAASLIQTADFSDRARMKDLFLEFRNDVKAQILPSGSSFTSLRAGSHLSPVFAREEQWKGIEQVRFLYDTASDIDARIDGICSDLEKMRRLLLAKSRLTINLTAHSKIHGEAERTFGSFIDTLPAGESGNFIFELPCNTDGLRTESIVLPSAVNFASTVLPASSFVSSEHAHEVVVAQMLKTNYLWEHVRMRGGAYGVSSSVNGGEMLFSFSSYRDPNITSTLETYKNALDWIARGEVDPGELEKAVITIIGRDIRPLSPGEKGLIGYRRKLYKISDEFRQKKRDELLSTAPANVRAAAERLREGFDDSYSVVLGGEDAITALPDNFSGFKENRIELR
ncbi:MAG: hypothetical protein HN368_11940, partial [Spirochaetales bacterium]|nr:hypothetical protein [Spirochaetales bacterium]